jgi:hypothetical protein
MEFKNPRSAWRAKCEDCPFTIGPDYGERVYPFVEDFPDTDAGRWAAERRAIEHREANPGHNPTVLSVTSWTMSVVEHLDHDAINALFGAKCRGCDGSAMRCVQAGRGRKCCPDCDHRPRLVPAVDEHGWHYLIRFPDGTVVQCAGNWDVAHKHLKAIRADWDGDTVPVLIGAYGPKSVGGPTGKGGVFSYGYSPNLLGSIDLPREDWIRV